jgi:hypothetical protein
MYSVDKTSIQPGYGSDHCLITLSLFKQDTIKQGPSFWKLNTSLLRDKQFTDKILEEIVELKVKYGDLTDKGLKWDVIKMDLRSCSISYSKFLAKSKRDRIKELMGKQVKLEGVISENPSDEAINEAILIKEEIEKMNAEKARGAMLRSKADWVEFGEKNSEFFLKLENRNRQVKNITLLLDDDDNEIQGQKEILNEELHFYKSLYTQARDPPGGG